MSTPYDKPEILGRDTVQDHKENPEIAISFASGDEVHIEVAKGLGAWLRQAPEADRIVWQLCEALREALNRSRGVQ